MRKKPISNLVVDSHVLTHSVLSKSRLFDIIKLCMIIYILSRLVIAFEYAAIKNIIHNTNDLVANLWKWDSGWYQGIVEQGYATVFTGDAVNWPFFPLWPLLIKIVSINGVFSIPVVGVILNQLIFCCALVALYLYILELRFSDHLARNAVIMLAISPANIYFCAGLTESLFLLLSLLSFYFLYRKNFIACIICAALLSATRMVGAFFIIPLVYELYFSKRFSLGKIAIAAASSISGLLLFVLYMQIHTGHPFGFLEIQSQIRDWVRPGLNWDGDIFDQVYQVASATSHIYDRGIFIFSLVIITGALFYKRLIKEALFNLSCILPGLISGNMWNAFRFDTAIFTFYLGLIVVSQLSKKYTLVGEVFLFLFLNVMSFICWFYWLSNSYYFA